MDAFLTDLRLAARALGRNPALALTALLTLAIGIGASTAIGSIAYGVLLRPLPWRDADRLVRLSERHPGATSPLRGAFLTNFTYAAWKDAKTIEGIAAYANNTWTLRVGEKTLRVEGASVSPSLFPMLGVSPARGRFFTEADAVADVRHIIVSQGFWETRLGGRADVVGSSVLIDGLAHTIVGVAPGGFAFPTPDAQIWTAYVMREASPEKNARVNVFLALAKLRPGATPEQASAEGTAAARSISRPITTEMMLGKGGPVEVTARPAVDELTREIRPALILLLAGVGLVLIIACVNVAHLLLSRGVDRHRELAVRVALGATGRQLVRHALAESLVLAVVGGAAGIAFGWLLVQLVPRLAPDDFPRLDAIRVDGRVMAFAMALSLAAGLLAGLVPAWRASRAALAAAMRDADARTSTVAGAGRRVLLAAEAALAVMLLVGASLLGRSFLALAAAPSGFDANNVLTARVYLTDPQRTPASVHQTIDALLTKLRATPGVRFAAAGNMAPFADSSYITGFTLPAPAGGEKTFVRALQYVVSPDYFRALGAPIRSGRGFTDADLTSPAEAVVVNETLARTYFRDGQPVVGRRYPGLMSNDQRLFEIIGVVGDMKRQGPLSEVDAEVYLVEREKRSVTREIYLTLRTTGDPLALVPELRSLVTSVAPAAALDDVGTLGGSVATSISQPRFIMTTLVTFAALALLLAAVGLYGALSYSVAQRRRELGVRAALGATRRHLIALVFAQGLGVTIAGLAAGLIAAAGLSRLLTKLLYGVQPLDAWSFVLAPLVLLGIAVLACARPARRAAAVDPAEALRSE